MILPNFETIKLYVLTLGEFEDSRKLDLQIEKIINEALAYCYRFDVPPEMELPLADVIVAELNKTNMFGGLDGNMTSYREGDMSINYGTVTSNGANIKFNGKLEPFKRIIGVVRCSDKTSAQ